MANRINIITIIHGSKETNNVDEPLITGIEENNYLEYHNVREFYGCVLTLKSKEVKDMGMSQQSLYKIKAKMKSEKPLNPKVKVVRILL